MNFVMTFPAKATIPVMRNARSASKLVTLRISVMVGYGALVNAQQGLRIIASLIAMRQTLLTYRPGLSLRLVRGKTTMP